mmetsp:Transcript_55754/g.134467  ORF Transcript_55754/g.134467 Transcript_55754/m.134467 type:complete len:201 (-) Transcript_55754:1041-1643(-)
MAVCRLLRGRATSPHGCPHVLGCGTFGGVCRSWPQVMRPTSPAAAALPSTGHERTAAASRRYRLDAGRRQTRRPRRAEAACRGAHASWLLRGAGFRGFRLPRRGLLLGVQTAGALARTCAALAVLHGKARGGPRRPQRSIPGAGGLVRGAPPPRRRRLRRRPRRRPASSRRGRNGRAARGRAGQRRSAPADGWIHSGAAG